MSLDEFDRALGREGHLYELNNGVVEVSDIPQPEHGLRLQEIRRQLTRYQGARPEIIQAIAGYAEAKMLIGPTESERHPDLSVYLSKPPDDDDVWSTWTPAIVIEVVSQRTAKRDYKDKPPDYLKFGVREYWIVDAAKRQMTALTRWRGLWKPRVCKSTTKYATYLLAGFSLNLKRVFDAAK